LLQKVNKGVIINNIERTYLMSLTGSPYELDADSGLDETTANVTNNTETEVLNLTFYEKLDLPEFTPVLFQKYAIGNYPSLLVTDPTVWLKTAVKVINSDGNIVFTKAYAKLQEIIGNKTIELGEVTLPINYSTNSTSYQYRDLQLFFPTVEIPLQKGSRLVLNVKFYGYVDPIEVTGENVGTGDGTTTVFYLDHSPVIPDSETIYIDGGTQTRDVDYTIDYDTGKITFTEAPSDGSSITADYSYYGSAEIKLIHPRGSDDSCFII